MEEPALHFEQASLPADLVRTKRPQLRVVMALLKAEARGETITDDVRSKYSPELWQRAREELIREEAHS